MIEKNVILYHFLFWTFMIFYVDFKKEKLWNDPSSYIYRRSGYNIVACLLFVFNSTIPYIIRKLTTEGVLHHQKQHRDT